MFALRARAGDKPRSPLWRTFRKWWLADHPACAACDGRLFRQVHHIVPFSVDPIRELDPHNVITLCERPLRNCHLHIGHLGNWRNSNPNVIADADKAYAARMARSGR